MYPSSWEVNLFLRTASNHRSWNDTSRHPHELHLMGHCKVFSHIVWPNNQLRVQLYDQEEMASVVDKV